MRWSKTGNSHKTIGKVFLQSGKCEGDFFVKRGLERFSCKLAHHQYDYELKNFNGEHFYILDKTKGIPEELQNSV